MYKLVLQTETGVTVLEFNYLEAARAAANQIRAWGFIGGIIILQDAGTGAGDIVFELTPLN